MRIRSGSKWYVDLRGETNTALEYARRAARLGSADALMFLVEYNRRGHGVLADMAKAVDLYQGALDRGSTRAMNRLGYCHVKGRGVEKNGKNGVSYVQMTADERNAIGLYTLAHAYANCEGVRRDQAEAFQLYSEAAAADDVDAVHAMGMCYAHGAEVLVSMNRAINCLQKTAGLFRDNGMKRAVLTKKPPPPPVTA